MQGVAGLEQAWRVENDHLGVILGADPDDAMSCGLRLRRGDGQFFANEAIEERGFPGVGEPGDGDKAGLGHDVVMRVPGAGERLSEYAILMESEWSEVTETTKPPPLV